MCPDSVPKVKIDVSADLTKSCERLADATPKGLQKLTDLMWGKREADVIRHKMLTAAQTQVDYERVLAGQVEYRDGVLMPVESSCSNLESQFIQHEIEQDLCNVASNIQVAKEALEEISDEQISDEDVSPDFFARWRREAKVIGSEELQAVWGKLLAEEIKAPNSISFRTMDIVKNISVAEAEIFMKIAPFVAFGILPCNPTTDKYPDTITTNDIIVLDNAGLIQQRSFGMMRSGGLKGSVDGEDFVFIECGEVVFCEFRYSNEISVSGLLLTEAGGNILKICNAKWFAAEDAGVLWGHIGGYIGPKKGFFRVYKLDKSRKISEPTCEIDRS